MSKKPAPAAVPPEPVKPVKPAERVLPHEGGSFVRQADGSLVREVEETVKDA